MKIFKSPPLRKVKALLTQCNLPVADLPNDGSNTASDITFLAGGDDETLCGVIGLEFHSADALLRSLAVSEQCRELGYGKELVLAAESLARSRQVKSIYLLTETAESFFKKLGYQVIARSEVSSRIKNTQEFSTLCPAQAIVMRKDLVTE